MRKQTLHLLGSALTEKDVENAYRAEIQHQRPDAEITSPHKTDGYVRWENVRLLLEAKYDEKLKERAPLCGVLGQLLLYLKQFEKSGEVLPNVLFVGDKNECLVLGTSAVQDFLALPLDWTAAPSKGSPELTRALVSGLNLLPYVYDVNGTLDFKDVLAKVEVLAKGEVHAVKATPENVEVMFLYWQNRVFTSGALTPVEQVDVFLRCLFQPSDVYLHPTKRGVLVVPGYGDGVPVNSDQYRSFFDHFKQGYKPSEIEAFYAMKDRLVEDDARRRQGAFFTPSLWVDEAHKYIESVLGPNWKDECIVWDSSCGTGNLTRDYTFADLILSTAEKADVEVIRSQGYNPGAEVFQYDFLNPEEESPFFEGLNKNVLPDSGVERLRTAAQQGKRLVWFGNPPYGTAGVHGGTDKAGVALTTTNRAMKDASLGASSQQLYAQFLFQFNKVAQDFGFNRCTVALFSMHTFMCSGSYKPFRDWWYTEHEYKSGFLFQASHFADVSGAWGISFTVWNEGTTNTIGTLPLDLKDLADFTVTKTGVKAVYNSDGREASKWVREPIKRLKGLKAPQLTSGLNLKPTTCTLMLPNGVAYVRNSTNELSHSAQYVCALSAPFSDAHGFSVTPANWRRAIALYGARKLVRDSWNSHQDEYLVPNEALPGYEQWVDDCHVYNLLDPKNNCTSMRAVPYDGKTWTIHNHFFWKSHAAALAALDTPDTGALYRDCKAHPSKDVFSNPVESTPDPYLAHSLPALSLSPEAQQVLNLLKALWLKSLPVRESYAAGKPELHLMAWDAGVYQLKHLWRDLFPTEWEALQAAFKALSAKLQPGVYTYGFLKA